MAISAEAIEDYFRQYGWSFHATEEENTWRTGFRGDVSTFSIYVRLTDNWIYFTIVPFVVAAKNEICQRKLYQHLMRLNQEMNMAKFTIDSDKDVVLTVELPGQNLQYTEFADALGALSYYADDNYVEVLNLAHDFNAVSRFQETETIICPNCEHEFPTPHEIQKPEPTAPIKDDDLDWGDEE